MTYIEEYYKWIIKNPNKVCNKIKKVYEKLVKDLKAQRKVSFLVNGKEISHTYRFDEKKSLKPIHFIEKYCKQSKGKWSGKALKLELFQKAMIQACFGFVDENGLRKYRKLLFFVARKNGKSVLGSALATYMLTKDRETSLTKIIPITTTLR